MNPSDTVIRLVVGVAPPNTFSIHEGVPCQSSGFFKNAMKPEWSSSREDPHQILLVEDDPEDVKFYIQWLYEKRWSVDLYHAHLMNHSLIQKAERAEKVFVKLARAYVFGERILDNLYKKSVMRYMVIVAGESDWYPGPNGAKIIWEGTNPGAWARKLLSDRLAFNSHDDSEQAVGWMTAIDEYPQEMLAQAMKTMIKLRSNDVSKLDLETMARPWQDMESYFTEPQAQAEHA